MVKVTHPLKSVIIQKYIYGLSLNDISNDTGISKTTAHNVVFEWKSRLASMDLEEIRRFTAEMGKAGISVQQCVQGFRTFQMLKDFDINDEFDTWIDEDIKIEDKNFDPLPIQNQNSQLDHTWSNDNTNQIAERSKENENSKDKLNQISYFIKTIYKNCKTHHIEPDIVIKWIEDLLEHFSISDTKSNVSSYDNFQKQKASYYHELAIQKSGPDKEVRDEIPLISRISYFIEQKKKEIENLENLKGLINQEIDQLNKRKESIILDLTKTIEKEKSAFSYLRWYNSLRQELYDKFQLAIEEKYSEFAKAINDFKDHDFDALKIINEYKEIKSLRQERNFIQDDINLNSPVRNTLLTQIAQLQDQLNYSKHTMNIYDELFKIGFGLKELKQLYGTIVEISLANKIRLDEAVSKFLKDIDNHYDEKMGLETTINKLKSEKKKLEDEVPQYQQYLQLQGIVAPIIIHLNNNGVTNESIISINQLVMAFKNTNFVDEVSNQQWEAKDGSNKKIDKRNISSNEFWRLFIEKLKSLKNINLEIERQSAILNILKTQIINLDGKKQELEKLYSESACNLNYIFTQTSYSIDLAKQINLEINKRIIMAPRFSPIFLILIISNNKGKKKEDR